MKNTNQIETICKKYGEPCFWAAITHLFDVGAKNITPENIEETKQDIYNHELQRSKTNSKRIPLMAPDYQCKVLDCSGELAAFDICDLLYYIAAHLISTEHENEIEDE